MWILSDNNELYKDKRDWSEFADNFFTIKAIHKKDQKGKLTCEIARYEISEVWTSKEQPEMWDKSFYISQDKRVAVISFSTIKEARSYLSMLGWVLNAPPEIPLDQIICPALIDISDNAEELLALKEKEKHEAEERLRIEQERLERARRMADERAKRLKAYSNTKINEARTYIFLFDDNRIKIGKAINVARRAYQKQNDVGRPVIKACASIAVSDSEAYKLENKCHRHFSDRRCLGEFFEVPFDEARDFLKTLTEVESLW